MALGGGWTQGEEGRAFLVVERAYAKTLRLYGTCSIRRAGRRPVAQEEAGEGGEPRLLGSGSQS